MRRLRMFAILGLLATAAPASASPAAFKALTDEYWAFVMRENPTFASSLGIHDYDDQLGDISLAAEDRRAAQSAAFLDRLQAIPDASLSLADRGNKAILVRTLSESIEA